MVLVSVIIELGVTHILSAFGSAVHRLRGHGPPIVLEATFPFRAPGRSPGRCDRAPPVAERARLADRGARGARIALDRDAEGGPTPEHPRARTPIMSPFARFGTQERSRRA